MRAAPDFEYYNWVDQFNTLGLGENIPIVTGTSSDSLQAFNPATKKWTIMRVPYPMGFFSRGMDGRIDNPNAGWKGRGIWGDLRRRYDLAHRRRGWHEEQSIEIPASPESAR